jgi:hypothetical protein
MAGLRMVSPRNDAPISNLTQEIVPLEKKPRDRMKRMMSIDLNLDYHAAHWDPNVRRKAAILKMNRQCIPLKTTDKLQPLNRRIFGCPEAATRAEYRRSSSNHPTEKIRAQDAARMLVDWWDRFSTAATEAAWTVYVSGGLRKKMKKVTSGAWTILTLLSAAVKKSATHNEIPCKKLSSFR